MAKITHEAKVDAAAYKDQDVCWGQSVQGPVHAHPSSVNRFLAATGFLVYHEKVRVVGLFYASFKNNYSTRIILYWGKKGES